MEEQILFRAPTQELAELLRKFAKGEETDMQISLQPADSGRPDQFLLNVGDTRYAASLYTLPTVIESAKPGDVSRGAIYKTGEVGRMLYIHPEPINKPSAKPSTAEADGGVSESKTDGDKPATQVISPPPTLVQNPAIHASPGDLIADSGITPPSQHIVQRRFKRAQRFITKYSKEEIAEAERVLLDLQYGDTYMHVAEEMVDAEEWMGPAFQYGGDHFTLVYENGVLTDMYQMQHPTEHGSLYLRAKKAQAVPKPVRPNSDGTFGTPPTANHVKPLRTAPVRRTTSLSTAGRVPSTGAPNPAPAAAPIESEPAAVPIFDDFQEALIYGLGEEEDENMFADGIGGPDIPIPSASFADDSFALEHADTSAAWGAPADGAKASTFDNLDAVLGEEEEQQEQEQLEAFADNEQLVEAEPAVEDSPEVKEQLRVIEDLQRQLQDAEAKVASTTVVILRTRFEKEVADRRARLNEAQARLDELRAK